MERVLEEIGLRNLTSAGELSDASETGTRVASLRKDTLPIYNLESSQNVSPSPIDWIYATAPKPKQRHALSASQSPNMAMMASASSGNPYQQYDSTSIEQDLIDPDDGNAPAPNANTLCQRLTGLHSRHQRPR